LLLFFLLLKTAPLQLFSCHFIEEVGVESSRWVLAFEPEFWRLEFRQWRATTTGRIFRDFNFGRLPIFGGLAPISFEKAGFLGGCRILEGAVGFEKAGFFHPQQIRAQGEG
jgi:hypothetical protein